MDQELSLHLTHQQNLSLYLVQTALSFGANDIDGTVTEEKITHDAGTSAPERLPKDRLIQLIRSAGYTPVQRTTTYEEIEVLS